MAAQVDHQLLMAVHFREPVKLRGIRFVANVSGSSCVCVVLCLCGWVEVDEKSYVTIRQ